MLMFAKHNRAALFDTTQTDETVKISSGALWKIDPCFNSVLWLVTASYFFLHLQEAPTDLAH